MRLKDLWITPWSSCLSSCLPSIITRWPTVFTWISSGLKWVTSKLTLNCFSSTLTTETPVSWGTVRCLRGRTYQPRKSVGGNRSSSRIPAPKFCSNRLKSAGKSDPHGFDHRSRACLWKGSSNGTRCPAMFLQITTGNVLVLIATKPNERIICGRVSSIMAQDHDAVAFTWISKSMTILEKTVQWLHLANGRYSGQSFPIDVMSPGEDNRTANVLIFRLLALWNMLPKIPWQLRLMPTDTHTYLRNAHGFHIAFMTIAVLTTRPKFAPSSGAMLVDGRAAILTQFVYKGQSCRVWQRERKMSAFISLRLSSWILQNGLDYRTDIRWRS